MALSLSNKDKHSEAIRFLKKLIDIFQSLKIDSGTFKPVQAGLILSTLSILYLQGFLFNEEKYSFVLTSRFMQDSLGKLYSTFCHCNPIRKPVEFKMVLKIINLSQYLKPASMGSYELYDDAFYLVDLGNIREAASEEPAENFENVPEMNDLSEQNSFFSYCGYIVSEVIKNDVVCESCVHAAGATKSGGPMSQLTNLKAYKEGSLISI